MNVFYIVWSNKDIILKRHKVWRTVSIPYHIILAMS